MMDDEISEPLPNWMWFFMGVLWGVILTIVYLWWVGVIQ